MINKIPFSEKELEILGQHINTTMCFGAPPMIYNTPITPRENIKACLRRDGSAMWMPAFTDFLQVESRVNRDHIARAEVLDMGPLYPDEEKGGPDMFGVEWVYVPVAGGSMENPNNPHLLEDANDWPEIIKFPDVEAMDWEACWELNKPLNETQRGYFISFQNGLFERLISFMGFEEAAVAMIDEDQQDAIKALFSRLCDLYEAMIDKYMVGLTIDGVQIHDDWGSQKSPFFSAETYEEMLAPYIKRLVDFAHSRGLWYMQHSCGHNDMLISQMAATGMDIWFPQDMNDIDTMVEKYGDKVMLGVYPPMTTPDMSDEEIDAIAKSFAEKYAPMLGSKPLCIVNFMCDPRFVPAVYKHTRIILCGRS